MLTLRIIPCLDVRDGRVVKGIRFQNLRDAGSPPEQAGLYEEQGADELTLLDVSATPEGRKTGLTVVRRVRQRLSIPLTVGGGVSSMETAGALLDAGADKVGINTAAFHRPALLSELATHFGCQCTVIAIDAARRQHDKEGKGLSQKKESYEPAQGKESYEPPQGKESAVAAREEGGWEVVITSGRERTGRDAVEWAREAAERGAGEILLTSWDRDGTKSGYDLDLIRAIAAAVEIPIIASGGAATAQHMADAVAAGADAVLAASVFHYGEYTVAGLKEELAAMGLEVRR